MKKTIIAICIRMILGILLFFPKPSISQLEKQHFTNKIIFDTDFGPDYDDVGAITLLHAMADNGECEILATIASNKHKHIAVDLNVINTYFNRPDLPIGVVRGNAVELGSSQKWDLLIDDKYPHQLKTNEDAEDALKLYRSLLSKQPDNSVTIVTVGFLTNMANLLQSGPDRYSPLTGKALIKKKVKQLICMAGRFDKLDEFQEFNVVKDAVSSKIVFDNWNTPILFSGFEIGLKIHTGLAIVNSSIINSPVKDVFALCIPFNLDDSKGRMSWDETAVLVAIRGYRKYFDIVKGKIICNINGTNGWNKAGGRDAYLVQKMSTRKLEKVIDDLIMHQPIKK